MEDSVHDLRKRKRERDEMPMPVPIPKTELWSGVEGYYRRFPDRELEGEYRIIRSDVSDVVERHGSRDQDSEREGEHSA